MAFASSAILWGAGLAAVEVARGFSGALLTRAPAPLQRLLN